MSGAKQNMSVDDFLKKLHAIEKNIKGNLVQCGMRLTAEDMPGDRKALIIEPQPDGESAREICKLVAGKTLDFRIVIEARNGDSENEEAQIVHTGLQFAEEISKSMRKLFYMMFEDQCENEELLDKIDKIDAGAGKLFRIYAEEERMVRLGKAQAPLLPNELLNMLNQAVSGLPKETREAVERAAKKATAEMIMELELDGAVERAAGLATMVNGNETVN